MIPKFIWNGSEGNFKKKVNDKKRTNSIDTKTQYKSTATAIKQFILLELRNG